MADPTRKPIVDRAAALLAGPFLLGQKALSLVFPPDQDPPADSPPATPLRINLTPPEHAIKRRG